jgi:hypothetical protein
VAMCTAKYMYLTELSGWWARIAHRACRITPAQLSHIDLYTCFPIAAQAAAREFGLESVDDGRRMTCVTVTDP